MAQSETQQRLVEQHLGLVRAQVAEVIRQTGLPSTIEFEDLVGFGTQGLIEAAQRYQPERGASFATFAYYRIRGAIYDGLRSYGWLNRREYARLREQERLDAYLQSRSDAESSQGVRSLEDDVAALADALDGAATVFVASLEAEQLEREADPGPSPHEQVAQDELATALRNAIAELPPQERAIIEAFYFQDRSLKDAGGDLGVSKSWACRVHAQAIERLRKKLSGYAEDAAAGRKTERGAQASARSAKTVSEPDGVRGPLAGPRGGLRPGRGPAKGG